MDIGINDWDMLDERDDSQPAYVPFEWVVHETDKAWLLRIDGDEIWFPKSQCELHLDNMEIEMPQWLHEQKF